MQRSTALSSQQGELRHAATGLNALVRVTFIRSLNGIGDSLNGLASAWLLSQFFGVEFSVCWPEANVSWAVPSLSAECITPKREWERRVISQVHGAKNTWDKRNYRDQAWQQMLVWGSGAYVGVGKAQLGLLQTLLEGQLVGASQEAASLCVVASRLHRRELAHVWFPKQINQ